MRFNALATSLTGAFVITNLHTGTVLDLSGSDQVTSTLSITEIIHSFDALPQFPDGLLMEDKINKYVEILLLIVRSSDLHSFIVDVYGVRPLLCHPKRAVHRQICRLQWSGTTDAVRSGCHWCNITGPVGFKPDRYRPSPIPVSDPWFLHFTQQFY